MWHTRSTTNNIKSRLHLSFPNAKETVFSLPFRIFIIYTIVYLSLKRKKTGLLYSFFISLAEESNCFFKSTTLQGTHFPIPPFLFFSIKLSFNSNIFNHRNSTTSPSDVMFRAKCEGLLDQEPTSNKILRITTQNFSPSRIKKKRKSKIGLAW